ncbi:hypothetical protein NFJ02_27g63860 [Pycnococcus provasolii]
MDVLEVPPHVVVGLVRRGEEPEVEAMEVDATVDNTWLWGQVLSVVLAQCTNASGRTTLVYDAMGKRPGIASVACTCRAGREAARAAGPLWLATVDCRLAAPAPAGINFAALAEWISRERGERDKLYSAGGAVVGTRSKIAPTRVLVCETAEGSAVQWVQWLRERLEVGRAPADEDEAETKVLVGGALSAFSAKRVEAEAEAPSLGSAAAATPRTDPTAADATLLLQALTGGGGADEPMGEAAGKRPAAKRASPALLGCAVAHAVHQSIPSDDAARAIAGVGGELTALSTAAAAALSSPDAALAAALTYGGAVSARLAATGSRAKLPKRASMPRVLRRAVAAALGAQPWHRLAALLGPSKRGVAKSVLLGAHAGELLKGVSGDAARGRLALLLLLLRGAKYPVSPLEWAKAEPWGLARGALRAAVASGEYGLAEGQEVWARDEWHSAAARVRLKPPVPAAGDAMVRAVLCQLGNNPAAWEVIVSGGLTARQVLTNARSLAAMAVPGAQVAAHAALARAPPGCPGAPAPEDLLAVAWRLREEFSPAGTGADLERTRAAAAETAAEALAEARSLREQLVGKGDVDSLVRAGARPSQPATGTRRKRAVQDAALWKKPRTERRGKEVEELAAARTELETGEESPALVGAQWWRRWNGAVQRGGGRWVAEGAAAAAAAIARAFSERAAAEFAAEGAAARAGPGRGRPVTTAVLATRELTANAPRAGAPPRAPAGFAGAALLWQGEQVRLGTLRAAAAASAAGEGSGEADGADGQEETLLAGIYWCEHPKGTKEYEAHDGSLDLDLSVSLYDQAWEHVASCCYQQTEIPGAKHSGDLTEAPFPEGAREEVAVDLGALRRGHPSAAHIVLLCQSYTGARLGTFKDAVVYVASSGGAAGSGRRDLCALSLAGGAGGGIAAGVVSFAPWRDDPLFRPDGQPKFAERGEREAAEAEALLEGSREAVFTALDVELPGYMVESSADRGIAERCRPAMDPGPRGASLPLSAAACMSAAALAGASGVHVVGRREAQVVLPSEEREEREEEKEEEEETAGAATEDVWRRASAAAAELAQPEPRGAEGERPALSRLLPAPPMAGDGILVLYTALADEAAAAEAAAAAGWRDVVVVRMMADGADRVERRGGGGAGAPHLLVHAAGRTGLTPLVGKAIRMLLND